MHIRRATLLDARALAELLNSIIAEGGTTAMTSPMTRSEMEGWIGSNMAQSAWHLAESDSGEVFGFQTIGPNPTLPDDACDIATFTKLGKTQLGIGSALFEATRDAARALGYSWINATIRTYNEGGVAYYQSRGFEPWKRDSESVFQRYSLL